MTASNPDPRRLLDWYDRNARPLPWRAPKKRRADPYRVWISEVMLQQTTAAAVVPHFQNFMARWPSAADLAAARPEEVAAQWAGLGYYSRARNLHACAQILRREYGGKLPRSEKILRTLPGIGPYTAAAIAAIAFGRKACAVDANVERVIARLFAVEQPLPKAKAHLHRLAAALVPPARTGDYAQAVMELGALLCTPRRPACPQCPWQNACRARAAGLQNTLPNRSPSAPKPLRRAIAFHLERPGGQILLHRRPPRGLLGGMLELPSSLNEKVHRRFPRPGPHAPCAADWKRLPGAVRHSFTHFHLEMAVYAARIPAQAAARVKLGPGGTWANLKKIAPGLPTLMRKAASHSAQYV